VKWRSRPMVIEAELIHIRGAKVGMPVLALRDYEVTSN